MNEVGDFMQGFLSIDAARKRTGLSDQPPVDDWDWVSDAMNNTDAKIAITVFLAFISMLVYCVYTKSVTSKPIAKKEP